MERAATNLGNSPGDLARNVGPRVEIPVAVSSNPGLDAERTRNAVQGVDVPVDLYLSRRAEAGNASNHTRHCSTIPNSTLPASQVSATFSRTITGAWLLMGHKIHTRLCR